LLGIIKYYRYSVFKNSQGQFHNKLIISLK
jgi:hypothetical protein